MATRAGRGVTRGRRRPDLPGLLRALRETYPDATCALKFSNPFQLLVATILSAQSTDAQVNRLTPALFQKYPTAADLARAPLAEIQRIIRPAGFFRQKARWIRAACRQVVQEHGGEVPGEMPALLRLPGVARKTANVVLGTALGIPSGVVVDTHVMRLARRMGLTLQKDPVKIERDLLKVVPQEDWIWFGHAMIHHGRQVCTARKPRCPDCPLASSCPQFL